MVVKKKYDAKRGLGKRFKEKRAGRARRGTSCHKVIDETSPWKQCLENGFEMLGEVIVDEPSFQGEEEFPELLLRCVYVGDLPSDHV